MNENETNISIRATKRFAAWFRMRAAQENMTSSSLGFELLQQWIHNRSPMVTEGFTKEPLQWDPSVKWEQLATKVARLSSVREPIPAEASPARRRH